MGKLEGPVLDENNFSSQIGDVNIWSFGLELINGFLGEVTWNVEVVVSDEEVWEAFLDVALDLVVHLAEDFGNIATVFEHFAVKKFEG